MFGGDGTTMQAAAALVGTDVRLGVIPGGTGNLLAGNMRIPAAPTRAARVLAANRVQAIDLGRMERPDGVHYFAVACGAGYDARVMAATHATHKRRWGMAAYVATTFRLMDELRCCRHRITDRRRGLRSRRGGGSRVQLRRGHSAVLEAPARHSARRRPARRRSALGDGLTQSFRAVWDLLRVAPVSSATADSWAMPVAVKSGSRPSRSNRSSLDGEPGGETPFTATVIPGALRILVP